MANTGTKPLVQSKAKKKWVKPKPYPIAKQELIKEEIRRNFLTRTKTEIVRLLMEKHKIPQRTCYKYIDKTIKEDLKDVNRENMLSEVLASKMFRKRQLLLLWQRMLDKEKKSEVERELELKKPKKERDKSKLHIVEYSPMIKVQLLRQLADEDKTAINLLQELSYIEKPKEKLEIEQRSYKFSIEIKKLDMVTPEMIEDDIRKRDSLVSNAKTVGSMEDTTGQDNN